ncbi:ABC transporter substrate-binding protein [Singulisphaera acidiphila]|uniref:ABC-type sugar transport system, periplasmic component n=1 Tax=Singulisphaera acidiphila (strain ATCC BAA-1392 / DSM 18658 / VKM B-2454 / MOB10) TaxID=886293 RepID=L0DFC1_SINAD|nr:extracellular solute-binding protein [Singulisphaera acidiphila]AGA27555.1 ABC-type sugar transport system, periplasmic component [Singulisphaera acidiphila DSM 18658]
MTRLGTPRSRFVMLVLLIGTVGCGGSANAPKAPDQPFKGVTIVAAAIGDPGILPTLTAQRGEWSANRGAEVTIREKPVDPRSEGVDVFLFRGDRLGELVDGGLLADLPEAVTRPPVPREPRQGEESSGDRPADPLQFSDLVPAYRDQVIKYGGVRLGLPYGGSALVLAYHRDAFESETNLAAAKEAGFVLKPPETWEQFDTLAKFFHGRDWAQDGKPRSGVALALGPDPEGVGDATYLARAASLGQHHDQYSFLFDADSMAPRIDSPPFVEALQGLTALKAYGPSAIESFDIKAARRAFGGREAAMLIDRAENVASWGDGKSIGVARLPGSERVFDPSRNQFEPASPPNRPSYLPYGGGWLVGVSAAAKGPKLEAAIDFAKYLIGPDIASRVRADSAFPMLAVRTALLSQGPPDSRASLGVDARQWSDAVLQTLNANRVIPGLRIPDAEGYLADLTKGRAAALQGETTERALQAVASAWAERTKRRGVKRQLWHYRRSLNTLATSLQPPAAP